MDRKISALKVQQRNPNRINVYLDGEYAFGLARIVAAYLQIGQVLSESEVAGLLHKETLEKAYLRALGLLARRNRSTKEIVDRLTKAGFAEAVIEETIDTLLDRKYLNDRQFTTEWIQNRIVFRPRSRRALSYELKIKGISSEIIENSLAQIQSDDNLAYLEASRYKKRLDKADWQEFRKRMTSHLLRYGFSYGDASSALSKVWSEEKHLQESIINEE
jgi:regulatory protein